MAAGACSQGSTDAERVERGQALVLQAKVWLLLRAAPQWGCTVKVSTLHSGQTGSTVHLQTGTHPRYDIYISGKEDLPKSPLFIVTFSII